MSDYPVTINLSTRAGASLDLSLTWSEGGVPVDLSGWTAQLHVRTTATSATVLVDLSSADGEIVLGSDGSVWAGFTTAHTDALSPGTCRYDLRLDDGAGTVLYLVEGVLKVKEPVTRP